MAAHVPQANLCSPKLFLPMPGAESGAQMHAVDPSCGARATRADRRHEISLRPFCRMARPELYRFRISRNGAPSPHGLGRRLTGNGAFSHSNGSYILTPQARRPVRQRGPGGASDSCGRAPTAQPSGHYPLTSSGQLTERTACKAGRSVGQHTQRSPAIPRLQPEKERTGIFDVPLRTAFSSLPERKYSRLVRFANESQSFRQAPHGLTINSRFFHLSVSSYLGEC